MSIVTASTCNRCVWHLFANWPEFVQSGMRVFLKRFRNFITIYCIVGAWINACLYLPRVTLVPAIVTRVNTSLNFSQLFSQLHPDDSFERMKNDREKLFEWSRYKMTRWKNAKKIKIQKTYLLIRWEFCLQIIVSRLSTHMYTSREGKRETQ